MNLDAYAKKLAAGDWTPRRALVFGKEGLGVHDASTAILAALGASGAGRITIDGKKLDAGALGDEISQMGLFAERRVVLVDGVSDDGDAMTDLLERVEKEPDLFLFVRHDGELDKRLRWYRKMQTDGAVFRYEEVKERDMPDRILQTARALGLDLPIEAVRSLQSLVGTDLLTARNELEKLRLFASPRTKLTAADVENVVGRSRDTIIYEINNGIAEKNSTKALDDLKDLLRQNVSAGGILSLLAREVRFLLQAKIALREDRGLGAAGRDYRNLTAYLRDRVPAEVKGRFGDKRHNLLEQHPYVVYRHLGQAARFGEEELAGLLSALSRADRAVKSGAGSPESVLIATVAAAAGERRRP